MTLDLGIVGLGAISRYYLEAIEASRHVRLIAACDQDAKRFDSLGPEVARHRSLEDLLARDDVAALLVTLPNDLHFAACEAALDAGKHVCCEKPLALRASDAEVLSVKARRACLTLMTAFHRRHNHNFQQARAAVRGKPVPTRVRLRYLEDINEHIGCDRWYLDVACSGGGCLADNGPNALDMLCQLVGEVHIERVSIARWLGELDLRTTLELVGPDGLKAQIQLAWDHPAGERKDIRIDWTGGRSEYFDLLDSFPVFKSSLQHEYVGLVDELARLVSTGTPQDGDSTMIVRLVDFAYAAARPSVAAEG